MTEDPRYPIGRFDLGGEYTDARREEAIGHIAACPHELRAAVQGLKDEQLDTPYREGGWTVRQVIHHVPDSHMNAFIRFKWGLTEDSPPIKTYDEAAWAELGDVPGTPVDVSLALLDNLHARWTVLLRSLTGEQWQRTIQHPEWGRIRLEQLLGLYSWHSRHHVAHVVALRERMGW
ncbi:MAG TPA: bacillithiol transferase BstA [Longimicrobium sp.]|nr:bacillithiol transferase BstA [Longimicrobium sp.]